MAFVENHGARIYWDEQGTGEPVLLIMGLGYPSYLWYRTRPTIAAEYRTIALDNRGSGRSDVPPGPYPIALMASDAAAVLGQHLACPAELGGRSGVEVPVLCEPRHGPQRALLPAADAQRRMRALDGLRGAACLRQLVVVHP